MKTECKNWSDCGVAGGGCCALGRFGGKPSHGICGICKDYTGPPRGLGDTVHRVAHPIGQFINRTTGKNIVGGTNCNCDKRRRRLNRLFPRKTKGTENKTD